MGITLVDAEIVAILASRGIDKAPTILPTLPHACRSNFGTLRDSSMRVQSAAFPCKTKTCKEQNTYTYVHIFVALHVCIFMQGVAADWSRVKELTTPKNFLLQA